MGWQSNVFNQIIIEGTNAGLFIYNGTPGVGTLIGSWSSVAGVDSFGNPYPAGINVNQGALSGVSISSSAFVAGTIMQTLISASQIQSSAITGGTISQTVITFNSSGGGLFMYTTTVTTNTYTTSQSISVPASVPTFSVLAWGGDAGGGGGSATVGGEAGGGAACAGEPAYPNNKSSYTISIGAGGQGGQTGQSGTSGAQTSFDGTGVVANPGLAGSAGVGGLGGVIGSNTIAFPGGNGGSNPGLFTSSAGGGGRAGSTGAGGNGANPTSNAAPGSGGTAGTGTGGIVGSNGVVASTNGNSGNAGGSGAGQGGSGTTYQTKVYGPTGTSSYYGNGSQRNSNGVMVQGWPDSGAYNGIPGDGVSFASFNHSQIGSDWSGWTVDNVNLSLNNQHSWYNSGCFAVVGWFTTGSVNTYNILNGGQWSPQGQATGYFGIGTSGNKSAIQGGTFGGIILGPSSSTSGGSGDLWNYGYWTGGTGNGCPLLQIKGHQGSGGNYAAGNGSNGKVIVSYASVSSNLVGALSPVAGTDANGNTYGIGYTGTVQAFTPGSSPETREVWHSIPLAGTWAVRTGGYVAMYRLSADNCIEVQGEVTHASTSGTVALSTALPAAYFPAQNQDIMAYATATASGACTLFLSTTGILTFFGLPAGTVTVSFQGRFALNGAGSN